MIRLQNEASSESSESAEETQLDGPVSPEEIPSDSSDDPLTDLESFSKSIIEQLVNDNIPPIPANFQLYFDRKLDEQSEEVKRQIQQYLEQSENADEEILYQLERRMKQSFVNTQQIIKNVGSLYKNLTLLRNNTEKRSREISEKMTPGALKNMVISVHHDLEKINDITKKQSNVMKSLYDENATLLQGVERETIYDSKYGLYNKRYLLSQLKKEKESIKKFGHQSTLVLVQLSKTLSGRIKNPKGKLLITKTISKLLLKTSRRSDIIAHYENGKFALLLRHSDLFSAQKASERLSEMVRSTSFFLGEKELNLDIDIGITKLETFQDNTETTTNALQALQQNENDKEAPYTVHGGEDKGDNS